MAKAPCQLAPSCGRITNNDQRDDDGTDDGSGYLCQPQPENDPAHGEKLGKREFQTDGEHQENHPEFRQSFQRLGIADQSGRMRADHNTDGKIPQNRGQLEIAENDHPDNSGAQHQQDKFKRRLHEMALKFKNNNTVLKPFSSLLGKSGLPLVLCILQLLLHLLL